MRRTLTGSLKGTSLKEKNFLPFFQNEVGLQENKQGVTNIFSLANNGGNTVFDLITAQCA